MMGVDRAKGDRDVDSPIVDPDGSGNEAFLPVFDESFFTDAERRLIPRTGDDEHPEWYVDHQGLLYSLAVERLVSASCRWVSDPASTCFW